MSAAAGQNPVPATSAPYESDQPTSATAEAALQRIAAYLDQTPDAVHTVRDVVDVALARIHMARQMRPSRRARVWLAKVTSFAFPRTFATSDKPPAPDAYATDEEFIAASAAWGRKHHHLCFTAQITEGGKAAVGRQVEIQMPIDDAERLAHQMLRMVAVVRRMHPGLAGSEVSVADQPRQDGPTKGDQVT